MKDITFEQLVELRNKTFPYIILVNNEKEKQNLYDNGFDGNAEIKVNNLIEKGKMLIFKREDLEFKIKEEK